MGERVAARDRSLGGAVRMTRDLILAAAAGCAVVVMASMHAANASGAVPFATTISAGQTHTCGVQADGTIACWGNDSSGKATPPAGTFTQVSVGAFHTCAIKSDRTVACWGDNSSGQAAPPAGTFSQVSAGVSHTCGVRTDGTLACWGDNSSGQASPPGGTFSEVSSGAMHTCALRTDGTLACWGYNFDGRASAPAGSFSAVSAGSAHTCGVQSDGTVTCWGDNSFGQATPPAGAFTQVSAGDSHTCGIQTDQTVACWGDNFFGEATPPSDTLSQVSAGSEYTCGAKTDGTLACWGDNSFGKATPPAGGFGLPSDDTPPVITVPADITAEATAPGGAVVSFAASATDPDDAATLACTPGSGSLFPLGANTVVCSAADAHGNTATASFTITVVDATPPVITINVNSPVEATGPGGATVSYTATATDAVSGTLTPACSPLSGSTFPLGTTTITCTATDGSGNASAAAATALVQDTTPPSVTINVTSPVEASGPTGAIVNYAATATDTVSGALTPSCSPLSGTTFGLGTTTITCTATDGSGNTAAAQATVVVEDTTAPTLNLPAPITIPATSAAGAVVTYTVSATDPDNAASDLTIACASASGSTFPTGATTVTCKATDPAGNSASGTFQVTVVDFAMGASSPLSIPVGGTASTSVTVGSSGGFSSAVALTTSDAPAGVAVTLNPSSVTPPPGGNASSTLTLHLSPGVTPTTFTLTVSGTFGGVVHSSSVTVSVTVTGAALTDAIGQLLTASCIDNAGIGSALTAKIAAAQGATGSGSAKTATNILKAFIDQARAQSGKHIALTCTLGGATFNPATVLIGDAQNLIDGYAVSATPNPITGTVRTPTGTGVAGAVVTLQDSSGATLATATTDVTGFFFFATTGLLTPGATYTVAITVPSGLAASSAAGQSFTWSGTGEVALVAFTLT